jgi:ParB family chromosome partitioning protein
MSKKFIKIRLWEMIVKKKLSVRETERKVNELLREKNKTDGVIPGADNIHLRALEDDLRRIYGTMVKIVGNDTKGLIQFTYTTREDLMRIADELKGENVSTTN